MAILLGVRRARVRHWPVCTPAPRPTPDARAHVRRYALWPPYRRDDVTRSPCATPRPAAIFTPARVGAVRCWRSGPLARATDRPSSATTPTAAV